MKKKRCITSFSESHDGLEKYFRIDVFKIVVIRKVLRRLIQQYLSNDNDLDSDEADSLYYLYNVLSVGYGTPRKDTKSKFLLSS